MNEEKNETEAQEEVKKVATSRRTTLDDLGLQFPVHNDKFDEQTFSFLEWDMDVEEKLSDLQSKHGSNVGIFVRHMMDLLLDTIYGKDYQSLSKEEKTIVLSQLHFPDMMYMYMSLRVEEMGEDLLFENITCPNHHCRKLIPEFVADLRTLEVVCKDKEHNKTFDYELKRPIIMEGRKEPITGLRLEITKWASLENVPSEKAGNEGFIKKSMFNSSIQSALTNGEVVEGFVDLKTLVRKIKKADQNKLGNAITDNNGGIDMIVGGECPHCKAEFVKPIEWGYDSFFGSSSQ